MGYHIKRFIVWVGCILFWKGSMLKHRQSCDILWIVFDGNLHTIPLGIDMTLLHPHCSWIILSQLSL
jgi:hypothetical protein